jgi:succinate dehydrogenase membrane anchor subunit
MTGRSPLSKVEGLGAAHSGVEHFWRQRATAVALVPLAIWFVISALHLVGGDHADVANFLSRPVNAILMILFVLAAVTHMTLGIQVVIEDYVESESGKLALFLLNKGFAWVVGAASIFAILKMALGT